MDKKIDKKMNKKKKNKKKNPNNREIVKISVLFGILFLAMAAYFVHFQVFVAKDIINNSRNKRYEVLSKKINRGKIITENGDVLAKTKTDKNGNEIRVYPYDNLFAQVVGITSHGKSGLEAEYDFELLTTHSVIWEQFANDLQGEKNDGDNLVTTLDVSLQKAADEAIGDNQGAVVVLDVDTGNVLAMLSKPNYNPNEIDDIWDEITAQDSTDSSLLNRATQGLYTPGSVFKTFTLLEYIRENSAGYKDFSYKCTGGYDAGNFYVSCYNGNRHGNLDLISAFAKSCNSAFIEVGLQLNVTTFRENNEKLLFNSKLPVDFDYKQSSFVLDDTASEFDISQTAIGQGKTQVTPLHMAMIASAIANKGELMVPRLVSRIEDCNGNVVEEMKTKSYGNLMTEKEAAILKKYMRTVVEEGTATKLNNDTYKAFGKTGTAETGDGDNAHSWYVGFAKKGDDTIAVAIVMENMPEGSTWAVPAVKTIFDAYFES